jgi:hypothetical protein
VRLGFKVHQFVGGFNRTNELLFTEVARLRKEQIDTAREGGLMPAASRVASRVSINNTPRSSTEAPSSAQDRL